MAENTDEEHLDNPTNIQSENPSDEIIPTTDTETFNPNQETENMEVHKHPHHVTHKKKWGEYLLEFFMLFLAVFLGFLVENYREHQVEKDKAKQYVRSFYDDLKTDTAEFARIIIRYERKVEAFSKRDECFDSLSTHSQSYNPCVDKLIWNANGFPDIVNADQTLLQLKNSGGLRLLSQNDADSILKYDKQMRDFIRFETTGYQERQYRIRELFYSILNYKKIKLKAPDPTVPLLNTNDPEKINKLFVELNEYAVASQSHLESLKQLNRKAAGLIDYFKAKYNYD